MVDSLAILNRLARRERERRGRRPGAELVHNVQNVHLTDIRSRP